MYRTWLSLLFFLACTALMAQSSVVSIAHAHNDYEHERPLQDAMAAGFSSVEADVYLINDDLLVAHDRRDAKPGRTLQTLYLEPLKKHFATRSAVSNESPFWLMIDVKSDAVATYRKLHSVLQSYEDLITEVSDSKGDNIKGRKGPLRIVISGNRAEREIHRSNPRFAGIDGRLNNLPSDLSPKAMPWISDNWRSHFSWRGHGDFPAEERVMLRRFVQQTHNAGRKLRFWATPDSPAVWDELLNAGVDLINADDLRGLQAHMRQRAGVSSDDQ